MFVFLFPWPPGITASLWNTLFPTQRSWSSEDDLPHDWNWVVVDPSPVLDPSSENGTLRGILLV